MPFFIGILPPLLITNEISSFRKRWNYQEISPPHITIKAQGGLTEDKSWLPKIENVCHDFPAFDLKLGAPATFGSTVLFSSVISKEIITLHHLLLDAIKPTLEDQKAYFEATDFIPHLTVAKKDGIPSDENFLQMRNDSNEKLVGFEPFKVHSIHVFSLNDNEVYTPVLEVPLRPFHKNAIH
ncbi:2'-5' RNA ligase family protein [Pseudalkalibacillus hwajinpoensis]|uniref:2'-5' RNA ligase family protein n=1 Tax=Guptibacillus hwajinpoensis TaxID=208199 RepID=A0A4U1MJP1_9BACL|nr:2'-5' RNA ligase family protein [Pseudalkalibacillus hwajinpoensis]TKD71323.1 2'-5' RNA ligase family protein [Pseudalkalibacillus hwajinpoensis]